MVSSTETVPHYQGELAEATAQSFVPRLLLRRLAAAPLIEPELRHVQGALLLSDIESFTAHIERLAQRGPQGLEEVISGFQRYFATVAAAVATHGGDILTVAGDSLLCWWPVEREQDLRQAASQAARAALAVQQGLASSDPAGLAT